MKTNSASRIWTRRGPDARRVYRGTVVSLGVALVCAGATLAAEPVPDAADRSPVSAAPGPASIAPPRAVLADLPGRLPHLVTWSPAASSGMRLTTGFVWLAGVGLRDPSAGRPFAATGMPQEVLARMESEARRYRSDHLYDVSVSSDPFDSVAEDLRAREAERIFTRAFNRTLESQADSIARTSSGLRAALDWLEDFGRGRSSSRATGAHDGAAGAGLAPLEATNLEDPRGAARPATHVGLRIGSHPRLVLSTGSGSLKARLELPLPGEPVRLSLERTFGGRARLFVTSGLGGDGGDWAAFSLNLRF